MTPLTELVISNVALAAALAVIACCVSRIWRNPHLAHALWLVVLVKLVMPPLVQLPAPWPEVDKSVALIQATAIQKEPPIDEPSLAAKLNSVPRNTEEPSPIDIQEKPAIDEPSLATKLNSVPSKSEDPSPIDVAASTAASTAAPEITRPTLGSADSTAAEPSITSSTTSSVSWQHWLLAVWTAGALGISIIALRRHRRLMRVIAEATEPDASLLAEAQAVAERLGLKRCPTIRVTSVCVSPLVTFGPLKSIVLIPSQLFDSLDDAQRRSILAHEFAHIRRRDHFVRAFEILVLLCHWWNPIAWWASRRLRQAEEACCDSWVVRAFPESRGSYGHTLLMAVEFLTEGSAGSSVATSTFAKFPFHRRIEMIMKGTTHNRMPWSMGLFVLLLASAILPVAAQSTVEVNPEKVADENGISETAVTSPPVDSSSAVEEETKETPKPLPSIDDPTAKAPAAPKTPARSDKKTTIHGCKIHLDETPIASQINGTIKKVLTRYGDVVKKGQVLAELEGLSKGDKLVAYSQYLVAHKEANSTVTVRFAKKSADVAKAELLQAIQANKRVLRSVTDTEIRRLNLAYERAVLQIEQSLIDQKIAKLIEHVMKEAYLGKIISPIGGVVTKLMVKQGERVRSGGPVVQVLSLERLRVQGFVNMREHGPGSLKNKRVTVEVSLAGGHVEKFFGRVTAVYPKIQSGGLDSVWAEVKNRRDRNSKFILKPGMGAVMIISANK